MVLVLEAIALSISIVQTLLAVLQFQHVKEGLSYIFFTKSGLESQHSKLLRSLESIKSTLENAENKVMQGHELSPREIFYLESLKDAVYDAEDLYDKFSTRALQGQLHDSCIKKVSLSYFISRKADSKLKDGIQNITKKLDEIASDAIKFGFKGDCHQPISLRRERELTCSFPYEENVIGRDDDKREIINKLVDTNVEGVVVSVLSIVGMGGLGKTTLARLVFNDERIEMEFPMRMWVCVSDNYQKQWNVNTILANILRSATNEKSVDKYGPEQVVRLLKQKLERSKYLLVLDDVWTEIPTEWIKLELHLKKFGQMGSRVVVTTRSKETAEAIRSNITHELKGLSEDNAWRLFEAMVGKEKANRHDLVDIGTDIVKKCANVPFLIRVAGSLLTTKDKNEWLSLQRCRAIEIGERSTGIMPILEFSYNYLIPPLKCCFNYCAVFPKDFIIKKNVLISLWMAQGYLECPGEAKSMEEVGEEYFWTLLQRCFFQDVEKDAYGAIKSCKIHDLMHDLAQVVSKKEIVVANSTNTLEQQIRHLYFGGDLLDCANSFIRKDKTRTYLQGRLPYYQRPLSKLVKKWKNLRALQLRFLNTASLPDGIGKLLHLRYLDLSGIFHLEVLPKSITRLVNLQTLHLNWSSKLRELPRNLDKLINLRVLGIEKCCSLRYMPTGLDKMTCLNMLSMFVVGMRGSTMKKDGVGELKDLRALVKLKGLLDIRIVNQYVYMKSMGGEYLSNKEHLNDIKIEWINDREKENGGGRVETDEDLLEDLQPHRNLKALSVECYCGVRIPRWAIQDQLTISLPNLVQISLCGCNGLQSLPWLGKLRFLKKIELRRLEKLEYMEDGTDGRSNDGSASFFPSLEVVSLTILPELKGWWRESSSSMSMTMLPSFPRLSRLEILRCPNLTVVPLCPTVEHLSLLNFNERMLIMVKKEYGEFKIRYIKTDKVRYLNRLPTIALRCLNEMKIIGDEGNSLSEVEEVMRSFSSSLQKLEIQYCINLRIVSRELQHLTALESLVLDGLPDLSIDDEETDMPWICLSQCLRSLRLRWLNEVVQLPKGMCYLTALQYLQIEDLRLKALPEWIGCLSSLNTLRISNCKYLESLPNALQNLTSLTRFDLHRCHPLLHKRCESPDGEDWPIIQHIPYIDIS